MFCFLTGIVVGAGGMWFITEFSEPLKVWRAKRKKEIEDALKK